MRALLDLLRDNEAAEDLADYRVAALQSVLRDASRHLKILDPEHGDEELINSVAAELAKLIR